MRSALPFLFIVFLFAPLLAWGQQGIINGTVVDVTGAFVAHAEVKLSLVGRAPDQTTQSADNGQFSFSNVPPGPYHLAFIAKGFALKAIAGELHDGETVNIPATVLTVEKLTTEVTVSQTQVEIAESQIKTEETQRLLGIVPDFFVTYDRNAAPLNVKQKAELTWNTFIDPYVFIVNGIAAGVDQARNTNKGFGQGAQGYAKRYGANYAGFATSFGLDKFVMPALFKQDPRYFYKGTGSTGSRIGYAISRTVICQGDNKKAQLCYSSLISRIGSGFLTNYYFPRADRSTNAQILQGAAIDIGAGAAANLFQEFLARKITFKVPCLLWACHHNANQSNQ